MSRLSGRIRSLVFIVCGALLYTVLNWVPILGALIVGLVVSFGSGDGFRRGFRNGISAGLLGLAMVFYLVVANNILPYEGKDLVLTLFIYWILLVWNVLGAFIVGLGAGFGCWGRSIKTLLPPEWFDDKNDSRGAEYRICSCGQGNNANAKTCSKCSSELMA
ncbi:MAG: hypothetical protein KKD39_01135 [Candidatus Altiarchaeota archaeon]|nr:hypothetical protein [Candidatus Altiarchaeota archaeon]